LNQTFADSGTPLDSARSETALAARHAGEGLGLRRCGQNIVGAYEILNEFGTIPVGENRQYHEEKSPLLDAILR
jgi:hypothetical protein